MTPIRTKRLILRDWRESDRALFHRINSDERVMEFFPFRRDRAQSDAKMDELQAIIDRDGYGFAAVEIAETGECAGFAGITGTDHIPSLPEGMVEIGWRLAPEFWGRGVATEAARPGSVSASTHWGSRKSSPSPSRRTIVRRRSWNGSACARSRRSTSTIRACPTVTLT